MFSAVVKFLALLFINSRIQQKKEDLGHLKLLTAEYAESRMTLIKHNLAADANRLYLSAVIMALSTLTLFVAGMVFVLWLGFFVAELPNRSTILLSVFIGAILLAVVAMYCVKRMWSTNPALSQASAHINRDWQNLRANLLED